VTSKPNFFVFTGGSSSGKSTIVSALACAGYVLVEIPRARVEERVEFVLQHALK
jgi:predicted ATPase